MLLGYTAADSLTPINTESLPSLGFGETMQVPPESNSCRQEIVVL